MNWLGISRLALSAVIALSLSMASAQGADLAAVKAEPNLDRRAELSLEAMDTAITEARTALDEGRAEAYQKALQDIRDSADLNWQAQEVDENRRNSSRLKRSDQALRPILRRLDSLKEAASLDERKAAEAVQARVQELQDKIVAAIFAPKKKKKS